MLITTRHAILALALALSSFPCKASAREVHGPSRPTERDRTSETRAKHSDHDEIVSSARELEIIGPYGSNYSHIDKLTDGTHAVIYETISSRSKYKLITPVSMEASRLIINCSYIRSTEEPNIISAGSYCRGKTLASREAIEDAISDDHTEAFSANHSWITQADEVPNCTNPTGIEHGGYKILRCGSDESPETTEETATYVFGSDLSLLVSMPGYEFSGASEDGHDLVFWKLQKDSPHEIVKWGP